MTKTDLVTRPRQFPLHSCTRIRVLLGLCLVGFASIAGFATQLNAEDPAVVSEDAGPDKKSRDLFYAPDRLLEIDIQVADQDWDTLRHQTRSLVGSLAEEKDWTSPFSYVQATVTIDGKRIRNVAIRKKGFLGSLDSDRPSLKIRFDKYEDQSPFGDIDRITLNNNKQDPSRLSQYLSYHIFRRAGVPCSRCNFAKVSVNGKNLGIYSNVEAIKPPMLADIFGDGSGQLYEGTVADFFPGAGVRFEAKTKSPNIDELETIAEVLSEEPLDAARLDRLVDIDAFLKYWAVESLIGFWDGYTHNQNNYYLYRDPANSKYYFLPWGTDSSFTYTIPPIIEKIHHSSAHANATLPNRLYRNSDTRERYLATLKELLRTVWNEDEFVAEIDRCRSLLQDAALDREELQAAMNSTARFIEGRRSRIESELDKWPRPLRHGPRQPGYTEVLGEVTGTFSTKWSTPMFFQRGYEGEASFKLSVDGETVELANMKASVGPKSAGKGSDKPPTITLTAQRVADQTPLTFSLAFSPADFTSGDRKIPINGVFIEGSMITFFTMLSQNPGAIKLIDGVTVLDEAATERDAVVKGKTSFRIMRFAGGTKPELDWPVGSVPASGQ